MLLTGGFQYEAVSLDLNDFSQLQNANGTQAVDLWVTACGINSCDAQFFQQLDLLAGKVNIRNVVIPMFEL
ncbi:MAG: hypothetical protein GY726_05000 [Proteobacteria bacterium]|nr:hypothetical protein [Pseudomonadota bacterium]